MRMRSSWRSGGTRERSRIRRRLDREMAEDGGGHVDDRLRLGVESDREQRHLRVTGAQGAVAASAGVMSAGEIRELDPARRRHEDVARILVVEGCPRTGTGVAI